MIAIDYLEHHIPFLAILDEKFKYLMFPKGRRWGLTHLLMLKALVILLKGEGPILWGDTVNGNIDRYVERFMMPILKQIPRKHWKWSQQKKELILFDSVMDFRSADRPENWEGFGYKWIILNEAGIILKNSNLYYNTVLPMLLDFPDSKLIAGGTPKGKTHKGEEHLFYTLCQRAESGGEGYKYYHASTYDNTNLDQEQVKQLEKQFDPIIAQQELGGEFIDITGLLALYCFDPEYVKPVRFNDQTPIYLSFDFNINPFVCLLSHQWTDTNGKRYKHYFDEIYLTQDMQNTKQTYIETMCKMIQTKYGYTSDYYVTGDATQNKGEITEKLKRNAWTQIDTYLNLPKGNLVLPSQNPSVGKSLELCNAMFSKPNLVEFRFDPKCKELIKDFKSVKIDENANIEKTKDKRRSHLLDAFRYDVNTWDRDFFYKL